MEVPLGMQAAWRRLRPDRRLMKAHGVREAGLEEVVVAGGQPAQHVGQAVALGIVELRQRAHVTLGKNEHLERPHRPPWNQRDEVVVLKDDALSRAKLRGEVVAQQALAGAVEALALRSGLRCRLVGYEAG